MPGKARSSGRVEVRMQCVPMGDDLCVALHGGDRPHIGAVAMAVPRPSLKDSGRASATASVLAGVGHKEDMLARKVALELATALGVTASVSCGIHLDGVSAEEIAEVMRLVDELTKETLAARGRQGGGGR